jgi:hypothetical protein
MVNIIFINKFKNENYSVFPLINGLSDHDAQVLSLLIIKDVNLQPQNQHIHTIRNINKYSIEEFKLRLSYESWKSIFDKNENTDVDSLFNSFLNCYLKIFYTSFPTKKITKKSNNNSWITTGIRISFNQKEYLYLLTRDSDDPNLKKYYKQYCKILTNVIKQAKRFMYNNQIINSANKIKTNWNIVKIETSRSCRPTTSKYQNSPDAFNEYFLSITDKITYYIRCNNSNNRKSYDIYKSPSLYFSQISHKHFPSIKFNNTSTKEIEKIIKSLNLKKSSGYDEIYTKILKISAPLSVLL